MNEDLEAVPPRALSMEEEYRMNIPLRLLGTKESKAIAYFTGTQEGSEAHLERLRSVEFNADGESGGNTWYNDVNLSDHAAMLDLAFRHFISGGDAGRPDERSFVLALKAQQQMLSSLEAVRRTYRYSRDSMARHQRDTHRVTMDHAIERRKSDERSGRSVESFFDRISQE